MSTGLKANSDGSAAIQVGGSDAIKIDTNLVCTGEFTSNIQPITASVAANALTVTLNPTSLDFRSATLGSGTVNTRQISTAISVVVPSSATLGTVSAQQSRIIVLAIDNAGTIELAVVNVSGGTNLTETGVISTTAITSGATSASTVYSTTARTSVAYRVVGYVESTQTTAGTWATAPSTIQGVGGQALTAMSSLGYGQTWQQLSASRAVGTTYYNTTGRPISVNIVAVSAAGNVFPILTVNGVIVSSGTGAGTTSYYSGTQAVIPPNASYVLSASSSSLSSITYWSELR
jgi:hypothetical protein